jgi:hypothetical protein
VKLDDFRIGRFIFRRANNVRKMRGISVTTSTIYLGIHVWRLDEICGGSIAHSDISMRVFRAA